MPETWRDALPDHMHQAGAASKVPEPGSLVSLYFPSSNTKEFAIVAGEPTFKYYNVNRVQIHIDMFSSVAGRITLCVKSWFDKDIGDFRWTVLHRGC